MLDIVKNICKADQQDQQQLPALFRSLLGKEEEFLSFLLEAQVNISFVALQRGLENEELRKGLLGYPDQLQKLFWKAVEFSVGKDDVKSPEEPTTSADNAISNMSCARQLLSCGYFPEELYGQLCSGGGVQGELQLSEYFPKLLSGDVAFDGDSLDVIKVCLQKSPEKLKVSSKAWISQLFGLTLCERENSVVQHQLREACRKTVLDIVLETKQSNLGFVDSEFSQLIADELSRGLEACKQSGKSQTSSTPDASTTGQAAKERPYNIMAVFVKIGRKSKGSEESLKYKIDSNQMNQQDLIDLADVYYAWGVVVTILGEHFRKNIDLGNKLLEIMRDAFQIDWMVVQDKFDMYPVIFSCWKQLINAQERCQLLHVNWKLLRLPLVYWMQRKTNQKMKDGVVDLWLYLSIRSFEGQVIQNEAHFQKMVVVPLKYLLGYKDKPKTEETQYVSGHGGGISVDGYTKFIDAILPYLGKPVLGNQLLEALLQTVLNKEAVKNPRGVEVEGFQQFYLDIVQKITELLDFIKRSQQQQEGGIRLEKEKKFCVGVVDSVLDFLGYSDENNKLSDDNLMICIKFVLTAASMQPEECFNLFCKIFISQQLIEAFKERNSFRLEVLTNAAEILKQINQSYSKNRLMLVIVQNSGIQFSEVGSNAQVSEIVTSLLQGLKDAELWKSVDVKFIFDLLKQCASDGQQFLETARTALTTAKNNQVPEVVQNWSQIVTLVGNMEVDESGGEGKTQPSSNKRQSMSSGGNSTKRQRVARPTTTPGDKSVPPVKVSQSGIQVKEEILSGTKTNIDSNVEMRDKQVAGSANGIQQTPASGGRGGLRSQQKQVQQKQNLKSVSEGGSSQANQLSVIQQEMQRLRSKAINSLSVQQLTTLAEDLHQFQGDIILKQIQHSKRQ